MQRYNNILNFANFVAFFCLFVPNFAIFISIIHSKIRLIGQYTPPELANCR